MEWSKEPLLHKEATFFQIGKGVLYACPFWRNLAYKQPEACPLQECWIGKTAVSDFRLNWKFLQKVGRQQISLNSHWRDTFIAPEQQYIEQTWKKGMFYIGQAIKLNNPSRCSVFLNFNRGLRTLSFIKKSSIYPKDTGFRLSAILVTVYKFMLHLWGFLLKSKTNCGHLLCCWLLYYHFLSEDRSLELISVDLYRHRENIAKVRFLNKDFYFTWMYIFLAFMSTLCSCQVPT